MLRARAVDAAVFFRLSKRFPPPHQRQRGVAISITSTRAIGSEKAKMLSQQSYKVKSTAVLSCERLEEVQLLLLCDMLCLLLYIPSECACIRELLTDFYHLPRLPHLPPQLARLPRVPIALLAPLPCPPWPACLAPTFSLAPLAPVALLAPLAPLGRLQAFSDMPARFYFPSALNSRILFYVEECIFLI